MQRLYADSAGLLKDRLIAIMILCRYPAGWSFGQPEMAIIVMNRQKFITSENEIMCMKWMSLLCLLMLISVCSAQMPKPGDYVRVSVLGIGTYYGTVTDLKDGLLSMVCNGTSEQAPDITAQAAAIYDTRKYMLPKIEPVDDMPVCIGVGTIAQLAWPNSKASRS